MNKLRIPKGASFDLKTGRWYLATPVEDRPFYNHLRLTGSRDFTTVIRGDNDAYFFIAPKNVPLSESNTERLTPDEYAALTGSQLNHNIDDDLFATGSGPATAISVVNRDGSLGENERGLILVAGIEDDGQGEVRPIAGANESELRSAVFLWDKLDWPRSSFLDVPIGADAEYLVSTGVMLRTLSQDSGPVHSKRALINLHELAFVFAEQVEPGRWSMGHGQSLLQTATTDSTRKILVDLHGLIHTPDVNVPFEEILEFRERRRSDLLSLRYYIDELHRVIKSNIDDQAAVVSVTEKLAHAAAVEKRILAETGWMSRMTNLSLELKFSDVGSAAVAGAATFEATNSILAAGKAAALGLGVKMAGKLAKTSEVDPAFKYVVAIEKEFGSRRAV